MNKYIVIFAMLIASFSIANAQSEATGGSYNDIFIELGGPGIWYSVNYEHHFDSKKGDRTGHNVAVGASYVGAGDVGAGTFPIRYSYQFSGNDRSFVELGGGPILILAGDDLDFNDTEGSVLGHLNIGYKRLPAEDTGVLFRAGFEPIFGQGGFIPWAGVGFGYIF